VDTNSLKNNLNLIIEGIAGIVRSIGQLLIWLVKLAVGFFIKLNTGLFKKSEGLKLSAKKLALLGSAILLGIFIIMAIKSARPVIVVNNPANNAIVAEEKVSIMGSVTPYTQYVYINKKKAAVNGNGQFSHVVDLKEGDNVVGISAFRFFKTARTTILVKKTAVNNVIKDKYTQQAELDKVEGMIDGITDINAVIRQSQENKEVRIVENNLVKEEGLAYVIGKVFNFGEHRVKKLILEATFKNEGGNVVDTERTPVLAEEQILEPGQEAEFKSLPTDAEFAGYALDLTWEVVIE